MSGTAKPVGPERSGGSFQHPQVFERYQRSEKALVLALQESYLQDVSTRKVRRITEKLCGVEISKDQACPWIGVSRMAQALDEELIGYRQRTLEKGYPYLVVDARYEYIREACTERSECDGRVESEGVLTVKGIHPVWLKHHSVPRK
jgi:transposase-like protein